MQCAISTQLVDAIHAQLSQLHALQTAPFTQLVNDYGLSQRHCRELQVNGRHQHGCWCNAASKGVREGGPRAEWQMT
jgi:hypothetical protein